MVCEIDSTGPILLATDDPAPTETATWTYFVTNNGAAEVTIESALDDQVGPITCMTTTVAAGQTVECDSESDLAQPHQYENTFSVTASTSGGSPAKYTRPLEGR